MYTLYVLLGKILWHSVIIALLSSIITIPFIWFPNIWSYTIGNIAITPCIIITIATIISLTCVTVTIK